MNERGIALINIVIVNWNSGSQLADAVISVAKFHQNLVSSVIVIDNASTDDSIIRIEEFSDLPFELHVIRNSENRGFGAACNQGAKHANDEYLLFLNPDTRLFEKSLPATMARMKDPDDVRVGIVGIQLVDKNNRITRSCSRFPSFGGFVAQALGLNHLLSLPNLSIHMADWAHDQTSEVDHVIGAYYLIRRSLFESLGCFDERFFVYLEDLDLSLRAAKAGWHSVYVADAQAFHAGGGTSRQVKVHRLFYSLRSRLLYSFKHFTLGQACLLLAVTLSLELFSRTIFSLFHGGLQEVRITWKAYLMLYVDLMNILRVSFSRNYS